MGKLSIFLKDTSWHLLGSNLELVHSESGALPKMIKKVQRMTEQNWSSDGSSWG